MVSSSDTRWIIKDQIGKIQGPYSTSEVLKMIKRGEFEGNEFITEYPGTAEWRPFSKNLDFYDALLEFLEKSPSGSESLDLLFDQGAENESTQVTFFEGSTDAKEVDEVIDTNVSAEEGSKAAPKTSAQAEIIDTVNLEVLRKQASFRKKFKPGDNKQNIMRVALIGFIVTGILLILLSQGGQKSNPRQLLVPTKMDRKVSDEEFKNLVKNGVASFFKDTLEGYLQAQKFFVEAIEGRPTEIEVRGLLCLVYYNLWPHVKQETSDFRAISFMAKSTRSLAPMSADSESCQIVQLFSAGRFKEAQSLIDNALRNFPSKPVFYFYKAEVAFAQRSFKDAIDWYEKVPPQWPNYLRTYLQMGLAYEQSGDYGKARTNYETAVQAYSSQSSGLVLLGSLQMRFLNEVENGYLNVVTGFKKPDDLPREVRARGYLALAIQSLSANKESKALDYAQKSYQLDNTLTEAKDLTLRLGGHSDSLKKYGSDSELVFIGDQYRRMGNCFAAQAEYKVAFEKDPSNAGAALKAAECLWEIAQGREAIAWAEKSIKADSKYTEAYLKIADFYSQRFDYINAARFLKQGAERGDSKHEILKGYALLEYRRQNSRGSLAYAEKALKVYDKDVSLLLLMAKAHLQMQDFKSAFPFASQAAELDPSLAEAHVVFAKVKVGLNGLTAALAYLSDFERSYQYVTEYKMGIGELYYADDQYSRAEDYFLETTALDPKNKSAFLWLGRTLQKQGRLSEAYEQFLTAATMDPGDAEPLFLAALLEIERLEPDRAIAQLNRVLKTNPNYPLANYYIGKAALLKKPPQAELALAAAEKERKVNPNLADAYLLGAEAYFVTGAYSNCAAEYQKAIRLRSQGAGIYVKMAQCYRRSGSLDVAEAMLDIASSKESGLADIFVERGALFEAQGDSDAAVQAYKRYLILSPNAPDGTEIRRRIGQLGG